jgi:hypothetical protein
MHSNLGRAFNLGHCQEEIFVAVCLKNADISLNFGHSVQNMEHWSSPFAHAPHFMTKKEAYDAAKSIVVRGFGGGAVEGMDVVVDEGLVGVVGFAKAHMMHKRQLAMEAAASFRALFELEEVLLLIMSVCLFCCFLLALFCFVYEPPPHAVGTFHCRRCALPKLLSFLARKNGCVGRPRKGYVFDTSDFWILCPFILLLLFILSFYFIISLLLTELGKWSNDRRLRPVLLLDTFKFVPNYNLLDNNNRIECLSLSLTLAVWPAVPKEKLLSSLSIRFHSQSKGKAIFYANQKYVQSWEPVSIMWSIEPSSVLAETDPPSNAAVQKSARDAGTRVSITIQFDINFPLRNCDLEVFVVYYSSLGFEYRSESRVIRFARKVYEIYYCLHGDGLITMADGSTKPVSEMKVGDEVVTTDRATTRITGVVVSNLDLNPVPMIFIPPASAIVRESDLIESDRNVRDMDVSASLCLTPRHPVRVQGRWRWPEDLAMVERGGGEKLTHFPSARLEHVRCFLYNFVTDSRASLLVNGREVCSLGQHCDGLDDVNPSQTPRRFEEEINESPSAPVAAVASFFGSERVVTELQKRPDWPYVRLADDEGCND